VASADYNKRHLVLFGEYIPFAHYLQPLLSFLNLPFGGINAGADDQPLFKFNQINLGTFICYEIVIEEYLQRLLPKTNVLILATNDAWFGHSFAADQHLQIAQFRALESGRPLITAANTGITAIIDSKGQIVSQAPPFKITTLSGSIQPRQGNTPWGRINEKGWEILFILPAFL
jgi:apolipoprotein N-acyltransferase